jgi:hypothetical protein
MNWETEAVAGMQKRIAALEKAGAKLHDVANDAESAIENGSLADAKVRRKHIGRIRAATHAWRKVKG